MKESQIAEKMSQHEGKKAIHVAGMKCIKNLYFHAIAKGKNFYVHHRDSTHNKVRGWP